MKIPDIVMRLKFYYTFEFIWVKLHIPVLYIRNTRKMMSWAHARRFLVEYEIYGIKLHYGFQRFYLEHYLCMYTYLCIHSAL